MKSNYLKLNKVIAVAICLLYSHSLLAQIDPDVNISKIKENQSENGKYTPYIPDVQHPVTLFSNEFTVEFIRKRIKDESGINGSIYWSDYVSIYNNANGYVVGPSELYLPDDYDEPGQSDPNAFAAKNAAFICLIGIDNTGSIMNPTQINQFKQVAVDALDMLKDNDYNKVYGGSGKKGYNTARRIILFLEAYDLLMAKFPNDNTVKDLAYLLQSHVNDFYRINKDLPWDPTWRSAIAE